jgi:hypothetical protein
LLPGDKVLITRRYKGNNYQEFPNGDTTSALWQFDSASSSVGPLDCSVVEGYRTVDSADATAFTFQADSVANEGGFYGNGKWNFSPNLPYETASVKSTTELFDGTNLSMTISTMSGRSYAGTETAYIQSPKFIINNEEKVFFRQPQLIPSEANKLASGAPGDPYEPGVILRVTMSTDDGYYSPIMDANATTMVLSHTLIDWQDSAPGILGRNHPISYEDEASIYGGSSISKYVTKTVTLAEKSKGLKVLVGAWVRPECGFDLYYKINNNETAVMGTEVSWVKVDPDKPQNKDTLAVFREYAYTIGGVDGNLPEFNQFKLKIVMHSTNNCYTPVFRDLRAIAMVV